MKPNQLNFFAETHEDLPLWSGTCARANDSGFRPKKVVKQESFIDLRPRFHGDDSLTIKSEFKTNEPCCDDPKLTNIGPNTWQCENCQEFTKHIGGAK